MNEEWRDIDGYVGLYQVSNLGRVRSLNTLVNCKGGGKQLRKGRVLKQKINKHGYNEVVLCKDGEMEYCTAHRLVAQTFIPNPDNLPQINHKDENKSNNRVENIEWVTSKQNCNHGTRNKRISKKQLNNTTISKPVLQFTKSGEFIKEYESTREAERQTGIDHSNISRCCLCKIVKDSRCYSYTVKSTGGFVWKYKN